MEFQYLQGTPYGVPVSSGDPLWSSSIFRGPLMEFQYVQETPYGVPVCSGRDLQQLIKGMTSHDLIGVVLNGMFCLTYMCLCL